jgi:hypothetical protein
MSLPMAAKGEATERDDWIAPYVCQREILNKVTTPSSPQTKNCRRSNKSRD